MNRQKMSLVFFLSGVWTRRCLKDNKRIKWSYPSMQPLRSSSRAARRPRRRNTNDIFCRQVFTNTITRKWYCSQAIFCTIIHTVFWITQCWIYLVWLIVSFVIMSWCPWILDWMIDLKRKASEVLSERKYPVGYYRIHIVFPNFLFGIIR